MEQLDEVRLKTKIVIVNATIESMTKQPESDDGRNQQHVFAVATPSFDNDDDDDNVCEFE